MQRLTLRLPDGLRRSANQKFSITFLTLDVSSGNSISVEHLGRVDSLRQWKSELEWKELEEVPTDVETTSNNRSLSYIEEDIQFPVLTPILLVLGQTPVIPNEDPTDTEIRDLRKMQKYIQRCKEAVWKRWRNEYLTSLPEMHNLKHNKREPEVKVREVAAIKGNERNKYTGNFRIITAVYPGRDGKRKVVRLGAGKLFLEQAVQHLYLSKL